MHMADALISPAVGGTFWAGTLGTVAYAAKRLKERFDERKVPLMGVLGAFVFAAQMINFSIPGTGSSGHLGGGLLLAILLGPHAAFLVIASVLTVQALFFADGGLLALGCNIWNLGVYPCFVAWPLVYRPLAGDGRSARRVLWACLAGAVIGLQMGAFSVVLQTLASGRSELPLGTFALMMQPIHLAIGIVEGLVTAGVINSVRAARPEILESAAAGTPIGDGVGMRRVLVGFALLAAAAGGLLSWFASSYPDGLEWSVARVTGKEELEGRGGALAEAAKRLQERTAFLPDYSLPAGDKERGEKPGPPSWPHVDAGTTLSGLVGSAFVFGLAVAAGWGIRLVRNRGRR